MTCQAFIKKITEKKKVINGTITDKYIQHCIKKITEKETLATGHSLKTKCLVSTQVTIGIERLISGTTIDRLSQEITKIVIKMVIQHIGLMLRPTGHLPIPATTKTETPTGGIPTEKCTLLFTRKPTKKGINTRGLILRRCSQHSIKMATIKTKLKITGTTTEQLSLVITRALTKKDITATGIMSRIQCQMVT